MKNENNRAVMVEYIDDCNNWSWYGVYINTTPEDAIKAYLKESAEIEPEKVTFIEGGDEGYTYPSEEVSIDVRAQWIDLIDIKDNK